jgi:hypothetical protein
MKRSEGVPLQILDVVKAHLSKLFIILIFNIWEDCFQNSDFFKAHHAL